MPIFDKIIGFVVVFVWKWDKNREPISTFGCVTFAWEFSKCFNGKMYIDSTSTRMQTPIFI